MDSEHQEVGVYLIPNAFVARWRQEKTIKLPVAVDLVCPRCGRKVSFSINWGGINRTIMTAGSRCPTCDNVSTFVLVDVHGVEGKQVEQVEQGTLYVYPAPKVRLPISGIDEIEEFSEGLERAYASAINVYNVREWTATAVLCRRLLEGITKSLLPSGQQKSSLYQQLQALPEHRDLKKPILTLADAIRKGGNLGAHFDLEKEPNEETATLMIELLEYLIEYLFVLPKRIDKLHGTIDGLANN